MPIIGPGVVSDGVIHTRTIHRVIYPNELTGSSEIFMIIGNPSSGEFAGVNLFCNRLSLH